MKGFIEANINTKNFGSVAEEWTDCVQYSLVVANEGVLEDTTYDEQKDVLEASDRLFIHKSIC